MRLTAPGSYTLDLPLQPQAPATFQVVSVAAQQAESGANATALFTAQDNQVLARFDRLQATLSLFQALGGSWLPPPPRGTATNNR